MKESVVSSDISTGKALKSSAWTRWLPLLLIWLAAFGLRLALSQANRVVWGDEPFYLWLGRNWITGHGYSFVGHPDVHHGPLFPMLAGLLYLLTHDMALSSEIIYAIFGALLVLPVYAIGCEVYDKCLGLAAAALTAVFPALTVSILHWGTMTEPVYMFFVYVGLWAGLVLLRPCWSARDKAGAGEHKDPWWAYAMAGLAFGLAYLTRPEAIGYFVIGAIFCLLLRLLNKQLREGRFWLKLILYVIGFGVAFLPYAYYVHGQTGAWMVSEKIGVAYLTGVGLAHGDTAAFDRSTWGLDSTGLETFFFSSESYNVSMLSLVMDDPKTFIGIVYMNMLRFAKVLIDWTLFPYVLMPLAALGLLGRSWNRERALKEAYLIASILPVLGFTLFYIQARYIVPFIPVLILWTACGLRVLSDWLIGTANKLHEPEDAPESEGLSPSWHMSSTWRSICEIGPAVLLVIGLLAAHPYVLQKVTDVGSVSVEHKFVGEYLGGIADRDTVIMCRYPAIAFHADTAWVPTPNAPLPEVLKYARHKGADYFVIDARELSYRPQFKDLVTGEHAPESLQLVRVIDSGDERLVVLQVVD